MTDRKAESERGKMKKVLIGNTFSMTLVRAPRVSITTETLGQLRGELEGSEIHSFWGHENTRAEAEQIVGASLLPATPRPAVRLTPEGLPLLDGVVFDCCWVLSPEYVPGFRPVPNQEVGPDEIRGWQVLKIKWS